MVQGDQVVVQLVHSIETVLYRMSPVIRGVITASSESGIQIEATFKVLQDESAEEPVYDDVVKEFIIPSTNIKCISGI